MLSSSLFAMLKLSPQKLLDYDCIIVVDVEQAPLDSLNPDGVSSPAPGIKRLNEAVDMFLTML